MRLTGDPDVPGYEGRPLARPAEELVDQGLGFDLVTLVGRRQVLRALGAGAAILGLAACGDEADGGGTPTASTTTSATGEIPDETAGPYPGDGSNGPNVLTQSGIVRGDIRSSLGGGATAEGVPMTLQLVVQDLANGGAPFAGAAVYVWHCNREGRYSLYSEGVEDESYLRGVQIADASGRVSFTSVFPACYSGRAPHVHFEAYPDRAGVADAGNAIATSQVALPEDACAEAYGQTGYEQSVTNLAQVSLADDNVFGDDDGATQLGTVTGSVAQGYTVTLTAKVDARTAPTGGGPGGDGAPSGAPGGGPPGGAPPSGPRPSGPPPGTP